MTKKHEWFKSDLTCLKDEEALEYIKQRLKRLNSLMNDVLFILDEMKKFNTYKEVIGDGSEECEYFDEENICNTLSQALENLSIVALLSEELNQKINKELQND